MAVVGPGVYAAASSGRITVVTPGVNIDWIESLLTPIVVGVLLDDVICSSLAAYAVLLLAETITGAGRAPLRIMIGMYEDE